MYNFHLLNGIAAGVNLAIEIIFAAITAAAFAVGTAVASAGQSAEKMPFQWQQASFPPHKNVNSAHTQEGVAA